MQLQLDPNKKEVKAHGTYGFPVNVSLEQLLSLIHISEPTRH